ncbi:MAG: hypothetical protein R2697_21735 [Ilumatobacteraceae bacterium]
MRRPLAVAVPIALVLAGCSGDDGDAAPADGVENDALCLDGERFDEPVVDWIEPAIDLAVETYGDPDFFEISADLQRVSVIVAVDGTAEQLFYCGDAGSVPPTSLGEASGSTFGPDAVAFDPAAIFVEPDADLDDPEIGDFAIIGDGEGGVVYDASILSDAGGVLLVRLGPDGAVLAVQAQ